MMLPAVGACTWASGSQVWTGTIGTLTAKAIRKAKNSQDWTRNGKSCAVRARMSKVSPPWK